jgi:hypothetical protein
MNDSYAEAGVKRKDTMLTIALRVLMIFLALIGVLLIMLQNTILLFLAVALIAAIMYIFPRLSIEYEYIYCDGQLDFDKIMGNAKRKTVKRIQFEQVELLAPKGSHSLDQFTHIQCVVKDFSSNSKDVKPYVIVAKDGNTVTKYLFEPNQKMIDMIKMKYPRKVSRD